MYKIGQTDGVAKCCSNVGVPVACIKTYLMKMAKSAADLPCACKAKSDMQVLASGEFKASTSSCCAGGTSSKTGCGGGGCCCGGCCGKSCCLFQEQTTSYRLPAELYEQEELARDISR